VGSFPNRAAVLRLVSARRAAQPAAWLVGRHDCSAPSGRPLREPAAPTLAPAPAALAA